MKIKSFNIMLIYGDRDDNDVPCIELHFHAHTKLPLSAYANAFAMIIVMKCYFLFLLSKLEKSRAVTNCSLFFN